jgi:uncharacterized membrane protein
MREIYSIFLKGLMVVLPVGLTLSLVSWVILKAEGLFGTILQAMMGSYYIPGTGLLVTLIVIFMAGMLVSNYLTSKFVNYFLKKFSDFPVIKVIYNPLKDLFALFGNSGANQNMKRVVLVNMVGRGKQIGLVTRDDFQDLNCPELNDHVAVYFPMSYLFGGITTLVPKQDVTEIDIPVDRALKLAITGWITSEATKNDSGADLTSK